MHTEMIVKVQGYQVLERKVTRTGKEGSSGRIYLPKEWVDKAVKVILLEPATEESDRDE
jgi:putative transposon-encoded protein